MKIKTFYTTKNANKATGLTVIIDVLRACTTIPILLEKGATEIIPVRTPDEARDYVEEGFVSVGEGEHGHAHDAFHHINSPSEVVNEDFAGKRIVFRSNNATQAIINADKAETIILASFVNLDATVEFIRINNPDAVSLVALGRLGKRGLEDDECAKAINNVLEGKKYNFEDMKKRVSSCECAILVKETLGKPEDVRMALDVNTFPIIPKVYSDGDGKIIRKV